MKIIFSRKGFDSAAGGKPSPIFPDGKILSLPIPDERSEISYEEISWKGHSLGEFVESLTNGKIKSTDRAHFDPDLDKASLQRKSGWRPIFGQVGAAQSHLENQKVGEGDLFLFFGLFQDAFFEDGKAKYEPFTLPRHIVWGWLQIEKRCAVKDIKHSDRYRWAKYHPHFHMEPDDTNTVYFAKKYLDIPGLAQNCINGAGAFPRILKKLQLTAPFKKVSVWKLPVWMYPMDEKTALTYHSNNDRWKKFEEYTLLKTVGRGQEFVLDCVGYPEAIQWLNHLFTECLGANSNNC